MPEKSETTVLTPYSLALKGLRESQKELQALLDARYASPSDIREGIERLESAEIKFRPRYTQGNKGLTPEQNAEGAALLEECRKVTYRAVQRVGMTPK
jgi:hypothetical protein